MTGHNATVGMGHSVHAMRPAAEGQLSYEHIKCGAGWTNAGGKMIASKIRMTKHEVTCKRCKKIMAQEAAAAASTVTVVHEFEGNTFEATMGETEAQARLAKLERESGVTGARIERGTESVKLTKAQAAALLLVAEGKVSYRPGRGPSSSWTRYGYDALVGAKFAKRTKSVDFLVENGLATLAGSADSPCPVVLSETGRIATGQAFTPIDASRVKIGRRVLSAHGAVARVTGDPDSIDGKVYIPLAIGDLRFTGVFGPYDAVPVLS